jgi:hypothetical protein
MPTSPVPVAPARPRVCVPLLAACAAVIASIPIVALCAARADAATPAATARLSLSAQAPVALGVVSPARKLGRTISLGATAPTRSGDAAVPLAGSLRVRGAGRTVAFSSLRLQFGLLSASVTGVSGGKRITVLVLKARKGRPLRLDARTGTVRVDGATARLSAAAAARIKRALGLRRAPSTSGAVGSLTLLMSATPVPSSAASGTVAAPVAAAVPQTGVLLSNPAPAPGTGASPDPDPAPCWATTPAGFSDWIACDEAGGSSFGGGNLRSWLNYVLAPVWGDPDAKVVASGGATTTTGATTVLPADGDRYDYRLPVASTTVNPDGTVTIAHTGRVEYLLPVHEIDQWLEDLTFAVSADRTSAVVSATAQYGDRDDPSAPPIVAQRDVLTVDLAHAASTSTSGGVTTYVHAPAHLTAEGQEVGGDSYAVGSDWGAFTIRVPS